jgi:hypothetical protein
VDYSSLEATIPPKYLHGTSIDIEFLKEKYEADNIIHYYPGFAAARKKG